ncbi:uncharacterized protein LOC108672346 [Hyalella azteca]|uniref:Uncharacterized protein LOC108672346 n=1 Tax=Hyalella azteca TaxID=294128 RepID=A0A8B7NQX5_HYAAZ|nr:uncharacterized protein LOC108672346 [Hyalella azteca]
MAESGSISTAGVAGSSSSPLESSLAEVNEQLVDTLQGLKELNAGLLKMKEQLRNMRVVAAEELLELSMLYNPALREVLAETYQASSHAHNSVAEIFSSANKKLDDLQIMNESTFESFKQCTDNINTVVDSSNEVRQPNMAVQPSPDDAPPMIPCAVEPSVVVQPTELHPANDDPCAVQEMEVDVDPVQGNECDVIRSVEPETLQPIADVNQINQPLKDVVTQVLPENNNGQSIASTIRHEVISRSEACVDPKTLVLESENLICRSDPEAIMVDSLNMNNEGLQGELLSPPSLVLDEQSHYVSSQALANNPCPDSSESHAQHALLPAKSVDLLHDPSAAWDLGHGAHLLAPYSIEEGATPFDKGEEKSAETEEFITSIPIDNNTAEVQASIPSEDGEKMDVELLSNTTTEVHSTELTERQSCPLLLGTLDEPGFLETVADENYTSGVNENRELHAVVQNNLLGEMKGDLSSEKHSVICDVTCETQISTSPRDENVAVASDTDRELRETVVHETSDYTSMTEIDAVSSQNMARLNTDRFSASDANPEEEAEDAGSPASRLHAIHLKDDNVDVLTREHEAINAPVLNNE